MTKSISTPMLNLMSAISQSEAIRGKFIQNEEALFDLYGVSGNDRDLIRNSNDVDKIANRLAIEFSQLSQAGKVAVRKDYDTAPALTLLYHLITDAGIRNKFIVNEKLPDIELEYRLLAFNTFDIDSTLQPHFNDLVDNADDIMGEAIVNICEAIKSEVTKIRTPK